MMQVELQRWSGGSPAGAWICPTVLKVPESLAKILGGKGTSRQWRKGRPCNGHPLGQNRKNQCTK